MNRRAALGIVAWLALTSAVGAEAPAGWLDAGEGFYYQPPVVMVAEGAPPGRTLVTFQIQDQSGRPAGETVFRIVIFSNEGRILRELTRAVPGFIPGSSLIVDAVVADIAPEAIGRVIVQTLQTQPPRASLKRK